MSVWSSTAAWIRTSTICPASHRRLCSRGIPTPGPSSGAACGASCSDKRSTADILTHAHMHTHKSHSFTSCGSSFLSPLHSICPPAFITVSLPSVCSASFVLVVLLSVRSLWVSVFQGTGPYCLCRIDLLTALEAVLIVGAKLLSADTNKVQICFFPA